MSNSNHTFKSWRLNKRPVGEIKNSDLSLVEEDIPHVNDNEVLARTIYFSLDPTNRIWMSDVDQYMEPVEIGDIMRAGGSIAIVEESKAKDVSVGDIIQGGMHGGWQEYFIVPGNDVIKLPTETGLPLTAFISVLGFTGPTAYFGLLDIGQPKKGETVVVSAAAGAEANADAGLEDIALSLGNIAAGISALKARQAVAYSASANLAAAAARIEDTDFAKETANLAKYSVLNQSAMAMVAQANQAQSAILAVLQ